MIIRTSLAALALAAVAATAHAQPLSPTDIVNRHMQFAAKGDVDGIVGDYADDAVVLTNGSATEGKDALRKMFTTMIGPSVTTKPNFQAEKIWQVGDVGLVSWEMNPGTPGAVKGQDSFLVKNGKIVAQAVWIGGGAPPAPAK